MMHSNNPRVMINGEEVLQIESITISFDADTKEAEAFSHKPHVMMGTTRGEFTSVNGLQVNNGSLDVEGVDQHGQAVIEHIKLDIAHSVKGPAKPRPRFYGGHRKARRLAKLLRYCARKFGLVVGNDHGIQHDEPSAINGPWVRRHWPIFSDL
jgi:hypothetical protein